MKNIYPWAILIFTITFVISPAFTDPFAGFTADQLPIPQIDPPIQPAGYAFAIWGLIYGWLLISAVFGVWKRADDPAWNRARPALLVSLIVGTPWLAVANANAVWATLLIFVMGVSAIISLRCAPSHDRWWFQAPVGIYAGWLTAASFVSLGSTAAGYGIFTESIGWAYIGIIAALVVAMAVIALRANAPEYGLAVIWALVGIIVANWSVHTNIAWLTAIGIAATISAMVAAQRLIGPKVSF